MRYYGFGNYYLSSLQQSLQAHHVGMEMINDYIFNVSMFEQDDISMQVAAIKEWSVNHKTIVLLNGGNSKDLAELHDFFKAGAKTQQNNFPHAKFHEDEQSLCGALTSVGIILPAYIYDTAAEDRANGGMYYPRGSTIRRPGRPSGINEWEEELIVRLNRYGLAK